MKSIDRNLTDDLLAKAKRKGATASDVVAIEGDAASVQVRLSAVDKLSKAQEWPELELYDNQTVPMDRMIELATRAEKAALAVDSRLTNSEGADFSTFSGRTVFANSHGFFGEYQSSSFSCSVAPIAVQDGLMQRDYWYAVGRKVNRLDSPEAVGQEAGRRTVRRLGARKIATCHVPVVLDSEIAGSFLGNLCSAVNGYAIYKGASYLVGRL